MADPAKNDDLVAIARVARPRGIRGEVIADLLTDFPERFDALDQVTAVDGDGTHRLLGIENAWMQNGRIVLKFISVDSIEDAETLRNCDICVAESEIVELDEDEYYEWQLIGCNVSTVNGDEIGTVKELLRTGGTDVLVIAGDKEYMAPFAGSICVEVDIDARSIVIDPPEGLLDL